MSTVKEKESRRKRLAQVKRAITAAIDAKPDKLEDLLAGVDDGWEFIREKIITLAGQRGEWAGYPLPVEHTELVIEPRHPLHSTLNGATFAKDGEQEPKQDFTLVNQWHNERKHCTVFIFREADGRTTKGLVPHRPSTHRAELILDTIGASQAWSVRAEFTALARLKRLVTKTAFRYYVLTGTFLESSKRSQVMYLFRKARPTLAFKADCRVDRMKLLCALCLHPIGYYAGTFAGSMVPTDDVIAHLLMMRGDERKFWSKCNQHDPAEPAAGV